MAKSEPIADHPNLPTDISIPEDEILVHRCIRVSDIKYLGHSEHIAEVRADDSHRDHPIAGLPKKWTSLHYHCHPDESPKPGDVLIVYVRRLIPANMT